MSKRTYFDKIDNPNGNLLFTVEQLNETTYADGKCLPVRCLNCGKIFYICRKDYIDYQFGSNTLQFCGLKCAGEYIRNRVTKPCKVCGKPVTKTAKEAEKWPNFFCCQSHAAHYNNQLRTRSEESKIKTAVSLKQRTDPTYTIERYIQEKEEEQFRKEIKHLIKLIRQYIKQTRPKPKPKTKYQPGRWKRYKPVKPCSICGQLTCAQPKICNYGLLKKSNNPNIAKFGIDQTAIGTERIYEEIEKFGERIYQQYVVEQMSTPQMTEYYGLNSKRTVELVLEFFGIKQRSRSESQHTAFLTGRRKNRESITSNLFKTGNHVSWDGKDSFYRSSYELSYMEILDQQQIKYQYENKQIEYFDSQKNKLRIAIPDFYLPDINTIVEVKSVFTYNYQNMIDKVTKYKELGYNFMLVLEGKRYLDCPKINNQYYIEEALN